MRTTQLTRSHIEIIKNQKTESAKRLKRTEYGIKEKDNSLFKLKSVDFFRSMPVECLHTVLLGACKYMLRSFMNQASNSTKKEILAIISSFPQCGFSTRLTGNICYYYKSFVGRDFKTWLQMCVFVLQKYLSPDETKCWFLLAKVFKIAYKYPTLSNTETVSDKKTCQDFVDCANMYMPEFARRLKVHLILHLVECIQEFGPASGFNTERFEAFNSLIRAQNIFGNRHAPSKDIAHNFAALEHLRFICCGGFYKQDGIYRSCGQGLIDLYKNPCVQQFINQLPSHQFTETKAIYQPGCLRKLSPTTVPCKLSEIHVAFCYDKFKHKFCDYITDSTLNLDLSPSLSMESLVLDHGAVFTSSRVLAHKGDFVKINLEISYGILLACCAVTDLGFDFCLVQELELQTDPNGDPILTEFECPLFLLTTNIHAVSTKTIICPVSVVHVCDALCCFVHENVTTSVERHIVSSNKFVYRHNLSNGLYCLNIFCISTDF